MIYRKILDIKGKELDNGHIVAEIPSWNMYVGVAEAEGIVAKSPCINFAFYSPHSYNSTGKLQILGHMDKQHPDYNEEVYNWYWTGTGNCPIKIEL